VGNWAIRQLTISPLGGTGAERKATSCRTEIIGQLAIKQLTQGQEG
jgi:hypothetical protein